MERKDKIEEYIIDNIRKMILNAKLPSVFCINKNISISVINNLYEYEHIYDNGITLKKSEVIYLQKFPKYNELKRDAFLNGIKINGNKFVVIEIIDDISGLIFIHAKSHEEGAISLIGKCYMVTIQYSDEILPMCHSMKIDHLKNQLNTFNNLLA